MTAMCDTVLPYSTVCQPGSLPHLVSLKPQYYIYGTCRTWLRLSSTRMSCTAKSKRRSALLSGVHGVGRVHEEVYKEVCTGQGACTEHGVHCSAYADSGRDNGGQELQ